MEEELQNRKKKLYSTIKKGKLIWIAIALILIAYFGFWIRTQNLPLLKDVTNNEYIPMELDSFVILRYAEYYNEHGKLMENDKMRYYPTGFDPRKEFSFMAWFISTLYNILHFFNKSITIQLADVVYPPVAFVLGIIFFFLLVNSLFNYKIALVASYLLTVSPIFLQRTIAGFSDKEAIATAIIFMSLYFFVISWKTNKVWKVILFSFLSGLTTAMSMLAWGGGNIVTFTIGAFMLTEVFLNQLSKKDFYRNSIYFITSFTILSFITNKYPIKELASSLTTTITIFGFVAGIVYYLIYYKNIFKLKDKFENKLPIGVVSIILSGILGLIATSILVSPLFLIDKIKDIIQLAVNPFGRSRWALTVAESMQPYFVDWISNIGKFFVYIFIFGSILLFYETVKKLKYKYYLTIAYTIFIFAFIMSRYSNSSLLNGTNTISIILYLGSLLVFSLLIIYLYIKSFYKDKEEYNKFVAIDKVHLFMIVWFLFMVVAARGAIRVLYIFAPVIVILSSFLIVRSLDYSLLLKKFYLKIIGVLIIILILFIPNIQGNIYAYTVSTVNQAKFTGPLYHQQWQLTGQWIRENTPEDAVFGHWWDYGYWVQTMGQRATVLDGGNAIVYWDYFMGRYVLMGNTEEEALRFLKARNATHLLIVYDEIGKYPAFSAIGSDENYDRFSWLSTFALDPANTQETRDNIVLIYTGSYPFDDDFVYNGKLFPRRSSGVGAILLPIAKKDNSTQLDLNNLEIRQPTAVVIYNGQQTNIPLECIFIKDKEIVFNEKGVSGCLRLIPTIDRNGQTNPIGAGIYVSPDVRKTLFTKLYLYGLESQYFKVAYDDSSRMPLSVFDGNLIGPMKIWEISYPEKLDIPEFKYYIEDRLPDPNVTKVNLDFY